MTALKKSMKSKSSSSSGGGSGSSSGDDNDGENYLETRKNIKRKLPPQPKNERFTLTQPQRLYMLLTLISSSIGSGRASGDVINMYHSDNFIIGKLFICVYVLLLLLLLLLLPLILPLILILTPPPPLQLQSKKFAI